MTDALIIGGGVIGTMIAHQLAKHGKSVILLEKNHDLALEATGANSGIIHSGHDPKPGTLKARFNLEGSRMYPALCEELGLDYDNCGAFVLSCSPDESLDTLERQAKERGIPVERLDRKELLLREPHLSDSVREGLWLPSTAVFTPWKAAIASMEEAILNGARLELDAEVTGIDKVEGHFVVHTPEKDYVAKTVINCAGVHADEIARMVGNTDYSIKARRGEYFILKQSKTPFVNHVLYPLPGPAGKGILCVPTVHGNVLLGPNAEFIEDKEDTATTDALKAVKAGLAKTVKDVPYQNVIRTFAGNRPTGDTGDFVIQEDEAVPGFLHVSCIESPGLSSAPAIAKYVQETWYPGDEVETWISRRPETVFSRLNEEQKESALAQNPAYGHMVCRCEEISEAEIVDAIHRPAGATTVDGVKKRVRPGMGGCQGGFCSLEVVKILARELGVPETEILQKNAGSNIIKGKAKDRWKS